MLSSGMTGSRRFFLLLLLCAVIAAQAVSIASEHQHEHSNQHCCTLCHSGPLPFLQPAISAAFAPALAVVWLVSSTPLDSTHEVLLASGSSRAPPA